MGVTQRELAGRLGVTPQAVSKAVRSGRLTRLEDGTLDLEVALREWRGGGPDAGELLARMAGVLTAKGLGWPDGSRLAPAELLDRARACDDGDPRHLTHEWRLLLAAVAVAVEEATAGRRTGK